MTQADKRNLSMMLDLYELNMSNGYCVHGNGDERVVFDVFYRKTPDHGGFALFAGLEQIVEYLEQLHFEEDDIAWLSKLGQFDPKFIEYLRQYHFRGDVYAFAEGSVMYPNEPIMTVVAPLIDAQLIETAVLSQINHQSVIATKAQRLVKAAKGRAVADFGARRAHNMDAAVYGARAAYIGGVGATATVLAGQIFGIPVTGTMAHSWVMYYGDEFVAFKNFAMTSPDNVVLLVDTYDVLRSGVPNAIRIAKEVLAPMGKRLKGIRLDSGDLAYLSKKARKMLDDAGLHDCSIAASNSLDEYTITSILEQGGCIDSFGVGERLTTAKSDPVLGAVYKLVAVERNGVMEPRVKVSASAEKITNPGWKKIYRIYNREGYAIADLLALASEKIDMAEGCPYVNPKMPWQKGVFSQCDAREMQTLVVRNGQRVGTLASLQSIRTHVQQQLAKEIWPEEQRFENPHVHPLLMTPAYYAMKMQLLGESTGKCGS